MPFTGTGGFTLVTGNPVVTGTNISSTVQNNTMNDFANGFANCVTRDGQSPPTANLPMGGQRHTGASNATGAGEYLVYGQALNGSTLTLSGAATVASVSASGAVDGTSITATGAVSGATLASSGNATVGGTLDVTGVATLGADPAGRLIGLTYTPTRTNIANVTSSTPFVCQYMRVGPVVTVSGFITIDPTNTSTFTQINLSLPVATNMSDGSELAGTACRGQGAPLIGFLGGDSVNDVAMLIFTSDADVTSRNWVFHFTYRVI